MLKDISERFRKQAPKVDFWSLRLFHSQQQHLTVRQNVAEPVQNRISTGAMITVFNAGGSGYAATADLSDAGLADAIANATEFAKASQRCHIPTSLEALKQTDSASYATPVAQNWASWSLKQKLELLRHANRSLHTDNRIVDWEASLSHEHSNSFYCSSSGARIEQQFSYLNPYLRATASNNGETQTRSYASGDHACQGGLEQLERIGFTRDTNRLPQEALELISAPNCPTGSMDLLLMPAQMMLQIHESIGHPLELDRILGDERNYAGTSFVDTAMFGNYRYGSKLLNVVFEPGESESLASYAYDDEGSRANEHYLIKAGMLERPLGGSISQARAGLPGVACARASGWNRPAIDRMANINIEPGDSRLEDMISSTQYGILMDTNCSWSIDDSRNKFQFGCEYARMIRDGKLAEVVKNPNYRGVSATFWRNLKSVGDYEHYQSLGTQSCGKGEPNQVIHVGHASPPCLFTNVEVFGGN